jgi:hypothetical protein
VYQNDGLRWISPNPSSPLAQHDLCFVTTGHGRISRLPVYYDCEQFVPRFLHAFGSGFRPTNQTTPSMTTHHGLVTSHSQKSSGQGGARETSQGRPTWPLSSPWIWFLAPVDDTVTADMHVTKSPSKAYSGEVLARALPEGLRYLPTWAWLSSDKSSVQSWVSRALDGPTEHSVLTPLTMPASGLWNTHGIAPSFCYLSLVHPLPPA